MAAGLSACSQSNAKLEGKSGIVKDEASKTEGDTGVVDQAPATYVQEPEYVDENDIISTDDTATIDGISYKIDSYEHTTEFGNRNKDTVAEFLKDSYEGNRNAGILYAIKNDMERIQQNSDSVYIDSYWLGGDESDVYHYVLGKGECITSELGYIIQDEGIPEDSKYIYYCIEGIDSKTNDKVQKYFKLEL